MEGILRSVSTVFAITTVLLALSAAALAQPAAVEQYCFTEEQEAGDEAVVLELEGDGNVVIEELNLVINAEELGAGLAELLQGLLKLQLAAPQPPLAMPAVPFPGVPPLAYNIPVPPQPLVPPPAYKVPGPLAPPAALDVIPPAITGIAELLSPGEQALVDFARNLPAGMSVEELWLFLKLAVLAHEEPAVRTVAENWLRDYAAPDQPDAAEHCREPEQ